MLTNVLENRISEHKANTMNFAKTDRNAVKREFPCKECGRTFPAKQNLGTHMRRYHKSEILVCPSPGCNKTYKHRWDLTSHTKVAHNGEKVMCPNCGSCFSKKSNLYNHLHRGKGCPKREVTESVPEGVLILKKKEEGKVKDENSQEKLTPLQKLKYAEENDEEDESEDELSDLVIDTDKSEIIVKKEETESESDDEEEVHVEESYVEVHDAKEETKINGAHDRLQFLQANRALLQPKKEPSIDTERMNNLHLLADIAMAHSQLSDSNSETSDKEAEPPEKPAQKIQVATIKPLNNLKESKPLSTSITVIPNSAINTVLPINYSASYKPKEISPICQPTSTARAGPIVMSRPYNSQNSSPPGYREIKPHIQPVIPQPNTIVPQVQIIQQNSTQISSIGNGLPILAQMIPVPANNQPMMMAIQQPFQNNGSPSFPNLVQLQNQMISIPNHSNGYHLNTNMGPIQMVPVIQQPQQILPASSISVNKPSNTSPVIKQIKMSESFTHEDKRNITSSPGSDSDSPGHNGNNEYSENDEQSDSSTSSNPSSSSTSFINQSSGTQSMIRCPTCGRVCSDPAHLRNHIKLVHSNITNKIERKKTLQCNICEKLFGRSSHLAEHIKSVHEGNKRVYQKAVCGECGRVFARKCSLNQHITAAHGGKVINM